MGGGDKLGWAFHEDSPQFSLYGPKKIFNNLNPTSTSFFEPTAILDTTKNLSSILFKY